MNTNESDCGTRRGPRQAAHGTTTHARRLPRYESGPVPEGRGREDARVRAADYSWDVKLRVTLGSILMPGPIVLETTMDLTYLPLAVDGLTRRISVKSAP